MAPAHATPPAGCRRTFALALHPSSSLYCRLAFLALLSAGTWGCTYVGSDSPYGPATRARAFTLLSSVPAEGASGVAIDAPIRLYFSGGKGFHAEIPHTLFGGFEPAADCDVPLALPPPE